MMEELTYAEKNRLKIFLEDLKGDICLLENCRNMITMSDEEKRVVDSCIMMMRVKAGEIRRLQDKYDNDFENEKYLKKLKKIMYIESVIGREDHQSDKYMVISDQDIRNGYY